MFGVLRGASPGSDAGLRSTGPRSSVGLGSAGPKQGSAGPKSSMPKHTEEKRKERELKATKENGLAIPIWLWNDLTKHGYT
jgi:hypothetical protein